MSLEDITLEERFAGALSDLAHVRRLLIAAKDRIKAMPLNEIMTYDLQQSELSRCYDKLLILGYYNAALARKNVQALPQIELFLEQWRKAEFYLRINKDFEGIPALMPQPLGSSEPVDTQGAPVDAPVFEPPQKGQNSPIPPPDWSPS